jgi:hypothetical protein
MGQARFSRSLIILPDPHANVLRIATAERPCGPFSCWCCCSIYMDTHIATMVV